MGIAIFALASTAIKRPHRRTLVMNMNRAATSNSVRSFAPRTPKVKDYTGAHRALRWRKQGVTMRSLRLSLAGLLGASLLSVVSLTSGVATPNAGAATTLASCKTTILGQEHTKGKLTVATDNPVYTPWFVNNKPTNGKGYESALVYALAGELGVKKSDVTWDDGAI